MSADLCEYEVEPGDHCLLRLNHEGWHKGLGWSASPAGSESDRIGDLEMRVDDLAVTVASLGGRVDDLSRADADVRRVVSMWIGSVADRVDILEQTIGGAA